MNKKNWNLRFDCQTLGKCSQLESLIIDYNQILDPLYKIELASEYYKMKRLLGEPKQGKTRRKSFFLKKKHDFKIFLVSR